MAENERMPLESFDKDYLPYLTEVSSEALGGRVLSCSDDFFASKDNLIKRKPSSSLKGQFGPNGALYDGWESKRHNEVFDWVIIRLAPDTSHLTYFDIDTSHFSGNEAPESQVFALALSAAEISLKSSLRLSPNDKRWEEVLPVVELGPNSRHIFKAGSKAKEGAWGAVMVRMIPDGGMARFRAYGEPLPPSLYDTVPSVETEPVNLLSALTGARVVSCSDAHFSPPGNLLVPGRGTDMSDGFETKRSQKGRGKYAKSQPLEGKERKEWAVLKMSCTGVVKWVEVDTAFHPGNYPVACKVEAALSDDVPREDQWTTIIDKKPLGPHRQHWLDIERMVPPSAVFSHIRLSIYPDGGLKRLRVYGYPLSAAAETTSQLPTGLEIPALPLTPEGFAPYGQVIQGFSFPTSAPKGIHTTPANQGTAAKFHRMAKVEHTYADGQLTRGGPYVACTHAEKQADTKDGLRQPIKMLERHNHTTQAFIPMGKGALNEEPLGTGGAHLVIVALNGKDDNPDLNTIRAFLATAAQGISYNIGTWHHSLFTLDGPLNYALVETQIGDGRKADCEIRRPAEPYGLVIVPPYTAITPSLPSATPRASMAAKVSALASSFNITGKAALVPELITAAAFAPYGQIIRMYPDAATRPPECDYQPAPHGLTQKYARLADIAQSYPAGSGAQTAISVYRATPKVGLERGREFAVKVLERHSFTTQAFVPMGKGEWARKSEDALAPGGEMLVIVALNGPDDRPDPSTLKAFRCPSSIGISYHRGAWHHPVLVLDKTMDLACIETQVSTGVPEPDSRDCEVIEAEEPWGVVAVPA